MTTTAAVRRRLNRIDGSSVVRGLAWVPVAAENRRYLPADATGLVAIDLGGRLYVYAAPAWVYGLLLAAAARGRSVGRAYGRLLRGRDTIRLEETKP